jgi:hypothetical protein
MREETRKAHTQVEGLRHELEALCASRRMLTYADVCTYAAAYVSIHMRCARSF